MRSNLPVTQQEYVLRGGMTIVSKTDLKGRITYINDDFIEASGFTVDELIGQPHNIVRHPDMPEEAFEDLWATLKAGRPWTGLVKNRCKNGDHYWVVANATPIREGGSVSGYMSVRTRPTRAQVDAADELYRRFREGRAGGLKIQDGGGVKTSLLAWLQAAGSSEPDAALCSGGGVGGVWHGRAGLLMGHSPLGRVASGGGRGAGCCWWYRPWRAWARTLRNAGEQLEQFGQGNFDGIVATESQDETGDR